MEEMVEIMDIKIEAEVGALIRKRDQLMTVIDRVTENMKEIRMLKNKNKIGVNSIKVEDKEAQEAGVVEVPEEEVIMTKRIKA